MLSMIRQIEIYEEMRALSTQMVEAARTHDWEALVALEKKVSEFRDTLIAESGDNSTMTLDDKASMATAIQRILDNDAEIRRHTEPWMEHVRKFLGDTATKRQVDRAYGTF